MIVRVIARLSTAALCGISESPEKSLFENTPVIMMSMPATSRLLTDSGVWGSYCAIVLHEFDVAEARSAATG